MRRFSLFLLACSISTVAQAFDEHSVMKVFFSVVLVRGYTENGSLAYGSGVVVAPNRVVTNCHVLRQTNQAWVSQGEETYPIVAVHADTMHDLCLVETDNLPLKPVALGSTKTLEKGDAVFSLNHSNGVPTPLTSLGEVKSLYPFGSGNVVRTSARFGLGASGSPLFDKDGRLIGINTFKTPGHTAYFYALPVEWLADVAQLSPTKKLPIEGQAFWELPDEEKPFFMQVALPQLHDDWKKLEAVSKKWVQKEPDNSEAWFELGSAQQGMKDETAARASFEHAIQLNPKHIEALYQLGLLASHRGDQAELHEISDRLAKIDAQSAKKLDHEAGCTTAC